MSSEHDEILKGAEEMLKLRTPLLDRVELETFVRSFLDRREVFLDAARQHGTPLYVAEEKVLRERAEQFTSAFRRELPDTRIYYAVKSNSHPAVVKAFVKAGLGLDVSSGLELQLALDCGARDIVFSGPGKGEQELALAVANSERVTVLMDSFAELERLERVAARASATVRAGVRLTADERGLWRKFGIPIAELSRFVQTAKKCRHVQLCGLQFHTSWNMDPDAQVAFIARIGDTLRALPREAREGIAFLDIGGGFWPPQGEWLQSAATPEGRLRAAAGVPDPDAPLRHYRFPAAPIEEFARHIGQAVREHIFPHTRCRICAEPGRWLCHDAVHILLTVADKKADDLLITDGGTNIIGWERFEHDYFPVINLSRPGKKEHVCHVLGSLCTPRDVWGYSYWGEGIEAGDVLLVPTQGAYTWSLRQEFIKPLPRLVMLPE